MPAKDFCRFEYVCTTFEASTLRRPYCLDDRGEEGRFSLVMTTCFKLILSLIVGLPRSDFAAESTGSAFHAIEILRLGGPGSTKTVLELKLQLLLGLSLKIMSSIDVVNERIWAVKNETYNHDLL